MADVKHTLGTDAEVAGFEVTLYEGGRGPTGATGPAGAAGPQGDVGPAGPGVPIGGTAGQVLAKVDATNYNTEWTAAAAGTVASVNGKTGVVVLVAADITSTAVGGIAATTVQGALAELDTDKAAAVHTHDYEPAGTVATHSADTTAVHGIVDTAVLALSTDPRFTDTRTPTDGSVTDAKVSATAAIALSKLAVDPLARANHTGTQSADTVVDGTSNHVFTAADDTKLAGVEAGATANSTDAQLRDRSTHTGTQLAATVSDLAETVDDRVNTLIVAGANITKTYDDVANTLTIDAAGAETKTINAQTGTAYTLALGDAGLSKFLTMTNAAASTLTVPANASVAFPVGAVVEGAQLGAGQVTLTPDTGVTINATPGLKAAAQYATFGLLKTATDVWLAFGRLAA